MGPQFVAGPGALTITDAETLAVGDKGLGGFQTFLRHKLQQLQADAAGLVGPEAYQAYMSPYQARCY